MLWSYCISVKSYKLYIYCLITVFNLSHSLLNSWLMLSRKPSNSLRKLKQSTGPCPQSQVGEKHSHQPLFSWNLFSPLIKAHSLPLVFAGDGVREFFIRVASLTFEANVLAELEKSGSRHVKDIIRESLHSELNLSLLAL